MIPQAARNPFADELYPLPIFLLLAGLLGWAVAGTLLARPAFLSSAAALLLLLLHLLLHWWSPRVAPQERAWVQYALAQGGLGIALTTATGNPSVWSVVTVWLIGESIGLLDEPRVTALSLIWYAVVGVAALFTILDIATALEWLGAILPTTLFVGVVVVLYKAQVEAREHAQRLVEKLEEANQQISDYAERVEELTLTNERQRMARELHDTLSQDVAGLVLQLEAVHAHLDAGRVERGQTIIRQALKRARTALDAARAAIDDLRVQDGRGRLGEQLGVLCARFEEESGVECHLTIDAGPWDAMLTADQKEQIERMVSEAVANIRQHAQATRVVVSLGVKGTTLLLEVEDDGVGFEPERVPRDGHYGLRGLHERARLLGGTLLVESAPGEGTAITAEIPLPAAPAHGAHNRHKVER